jgi:hypothetical protein
MKALIKIIESFENREAKIYWINQLKVSNTVKGKLIVYFNLV